MSIDSNAFVTYYRSKDLPSQARQARLAEIATAWRKASTLKAALVDLACRVQLPVLEPACALSPA